MENKKIKLFLIGITTLLLGVNAFSKKTMGETLYANYLTPKQLINWDPKKDKTLQFYKEYPIAKRVERTDVFESTIPRVMSMLNYDQRAGYNCPQIGETYFDDRAIFEGWNFTDVYISFLNGEPIGEISVPTPQEIKIGHQNGVEVLGNIFFLHSKENQEQHAKEFLQKDKNGNYIIVDKLVKLANAFHFDGFFFNNEADYFPTEDLSSVLSQLKHRGLKMVFYKGFLNTISSDSDKKLFAASSYFDSDYNWNDWAMNETKENVSNERLRDVYMATQLWDEIKSPLQHVKMVAKYNIDNSTNYSIGFFAAECPYGLPPKDPKNPPTPQELNDNFVKVWWATKYLINDKLSDIDSIKSGIGNFLTPKTVITKLPFETNFNVGRGVKRFICGSVFDDTEASNHWGNMVEQDILPNYMIQNNNINVSFDFADAWNGGSSLKIKNLGKKAEFIPIYLTACDNLSEEKVSVIFKYKTFSDQVPQLYLKSKNGKGEHLIDLSKNTEIENNWKQASKVLRMKSIYEIGVKIPAHTNLILGNIKVDSLEI